MKILMGSLKVHQYEKVRVCIIFPPFFPYEHLQIFKHCCKKNKWNIEVKVFNASQKKKKKSKPCKRWNVIFCCLFPFVIYNIFKHIIILYSVFETYEAWKKTWCIFSLFSYWNKTWIVLHLTEDKQSDILFPVFIQFFSVM